jgi:hypothetical protein
VSQADHPTGGPPVVHAQPSHLAPDTVTWLPRGFNQGGLPTQPAAPVSVSTSSSTPPGENAAQPAAQHLNGSARAADQAADSMQMRAAHAPPEQASEHDGSDASASGAAADAKDGSEAAADEGQRTEDGVRWHGSPVPAGLGEVSRKLGTRGLGSKSTPALPPVAEGTEGSLGSGTWNSITSNHVLTSSVEKPFPLPVVQGPAGAPHTQGEQPRRTAEGTDASEHAASSGGPPTALSEEALRFNASVSSTLLRPDVANHQGVRLRFMT